MLRRSEILLSSRATAFQWRRFLVVFATIVAVQLPFLPERPAILASYCVVALAAVLRLLHLHNLLSLVTFQAALRFLLRLPLNLFLRVCQQKANL